MEIWKRGSIGRKWHSRTHKRRFRVHWRGRIWSGTSPQCVPPADGSRSIIYERGGRRRATFRILEHPCRGSWLLPSKRKSPGWCGHRAEIKESPERQLDIYIYVYWIWPRPALAPSRSRFRSRYEIVRDNYAANRPAIRYGNRISEMSEENIEDSPRFWKFSHLSSYLLSGKMGRHLLFWHL